MSDRTAFLINSRGNPERLAGVCLAFSDQAARPDLLSFCIRADADDTETIYMAGRLGKLVDVHLTIGARPQALGAEINRMAQSIDAGFYHVLNDDTWPLTRFWDRAQFEYRAQNPAFVSCWMLAGPTAPDYPFMSRAWLDAAGGQFFTNYFPFWFDDRWLADVAIMVTGKLVHPLQIWLCANKKGTQRMRELGFWLDFYEALHDERVAQAQQIADNLGMGIDIRRDRAEWVEKSRLWHGDLRENMDAVQQRNGDPGEPDAAYLAAKAYAVNRMAEINAQAVVSPVEEKPCAA